MESLVCNRVPEGECEFIQVRGEGGGEREKETWGVSSFFFLTHTCRENRTWRVPLMEVWLNLLHLHTGLHAISE